MFNADNFNVKDFNYNDQEIDEFYHLRANIGPIISYRPKKLITIELTGGISTLKESRLLDTNNDIINNTSSTEAFLNFGIIIKPPINE